mmetsp:Transcript_6528/g.15090  ORF Transcript_6528/g.15090 Transcript_6528/m.15090 type:complete len:80 (+) Transcript_6528:616-855(+)
MPCAEDQTTLRKLAPSIMQNIKGTQDVVEEEATTFEEEEVKSDQGLAAATREVAHSQDHRPSQRPPSHRQPPTVRKPGG